MNGMIWLLLVVSINADGSVSSVINTPNKAEFNTEAVCKETGQALVNQLQVKIGTNNARFYWKCEGLPYKELMKSMPST